MAPEVHQAVVELALEQPALANPYGCPGEEAISGSGLTVDSSWTPKDPTLSADRFQTHNSGSTSNPGQSIQPSRFNFNQRHSPVPREVVPHHLRLGST